MKSHTASVAVLCEKIFLEVNISIVKIVCLFPVRIYLELVGMGKPSSSHVNCGGGWPIATHLRDTLGPGCNVCSENQ